MCGVFGVWKYQDSGRPDLDRLSEAARLMDHRGPDHQGVYADGRVGLAHTRLSLVDLHARSNQPFWEPTHQHCLVYNGEIYNFRELRDLVRRPDLAFETTGDTEVLLHSLVHLGVEETLKRVEGMFAFAWYDSVACRLVLARDRFGMKPLFFHDGADALVFASEIRALRPWVPFTPDPFTIAAFLQGAGPPTQGFTHFRGIRILPPGTVMTLEVNARPQVRRFFSLTQFRDLDEARRLERMPTARVLDLVDETLCRSVETQLEADVPVGAFCSGGVDSSVVMAIAARRHNNLAVFHANVVGRHSELDAATRLAEHLKLHLLAVDVRDSDFIDQLPMVTRHFGHPIGYRWDSIPLYMVSHLVARHGVRAVISGEGSDELFLGYRSLMPRLSLAMLKPPLYLVRNLVKRLIQGRDAEWLTPVPPRDLGPGLLSRFEIEIENAERESLGRPKDHLSLRMTAYHLRTLLHRNDSLGMSASIECRFPFLDSGLARLAVNLPYQHKIRYSSRIGDLDHPFVGDKWAIRQVAARYLPSDLSARPKRPFPTDAFSRMRIPEAFLMSSFVADLLELSKREIAFLAEQAEQALLLRLLHLDVWARVCLNDEAPAETVRRLRKHVTITPDQWQA